jgi:hypothetical protein
MGNRLYCPDRRGVDGALLEVGMAKVNENTFYLRVEPEMTSWPMGNRRPDAELRRDCNRLESAIRRHVDGYGYLNVEVETASSCSFCGGKWTEDGDSYNGGCCDEDEANRPAEAA